MSGRYSGGRWDGAVASRLQRMARGVIRTAYAHRQAAALLFYILVTVVSYFGAYLVRFEFIWRPAYNGTFLLSLPLLLGFRLLLGLKFRVGLGRWRFVGARDLVRLVSVASLASAAFLLLSRWVGFTPAVPLSVVVLEWLLNVALTGGTWFAYRLAFEHFRMRGSDPAARKRVLVVGAGDAGSTLVHEMRRYPGYEPVGLVDDDPFKWGSRIHGVEVVGAVRDLPAIAEAKRVDELAIAMPSASPAALREIVGYCEATEVTFRILPGIREVLDGNASPNQLRSVEVEDLLGREPVQLDLPDLREDLSGRTVLVTGAAGSIGAELCRQVALHQPRELILLDQAETPLYYLELEMKEHFPEVVIVPVIADVVDDRSVERVFERYRPSRVFHAAAYKHVPMMEVNPDQALRTNLLGTERVAEAAGRFGAGRFVLVSTDKAVAPANVMGATKRLAEMTVLEAQERYPATSYGAVRFGNVLGSAGSVIPLFRRQLQADRPLTITDPEATRYFMTIPEAVQLILQASLLPDLRGGVAMLEMGEPVRIVDLARNLLRLSGRPFRPGQTVVFTGLRPGEKLHETLVDIGEATAPTDVEKVRLILSDGNGDREAPLDRWMAELRDGSVDAVLVELPAHFPHLAPLPDYPAPAPPLSAEAPAGAD